MRYDSASVGVRFTFGPGTLLSLIVQVEDVWHYIHADNLPWEPATTYSAAMSEAATRGPKW